MHAVVDPSLKLSVHHFSNDTMENTLNEPLLCLLDRNFPLDEAVNRDGVVLLFHGQNIDSVRRQRASFEEAQIKLLPAQKPFRLLPQHALELLRRLASDCIQLSHAAQLVIVQSPHRLIVACAHESICFLKDATRLLDASLSRKDRRTQLRKRTRERRLHPRALHANQSCSGVRARQPHNLLRRRSHPRSLEPASRPLDPRRSRQRRRYILPRVLAHRQLRKLSHDVLERRRPKDELQASVAVLPSADARRHLLREPCVARRDRKCAPLRKAASHHALHELPGLAAPVRAVELVAHAKHELRARAPAGHRERALKLRLHLSVTRGAQRRPREHHHATRAPAHHLPNRLLEEVL
mmetsp:Transcript_2083/g.7623  ORF Transcript_2083/g.7623 Transcript_2083/m.7623 type:complete len:353 (+) Transcript_2083:324-1382(+)